MTNESKPQEWFYMQNETWNGPFKTSGLKELVKKGLVVHSTLLRLGVAGEPIKAHQVKSLFPNYLGYEQVAVSSIMKESIPKSVPILIGGAIILVFVLGLIISILKSNGNVPRINFADSLVWIEKGMVLIPPGKFMMGDQSDRLEVTLTKPFYMGKHEVTQEQWESLMGENPSKIKGAKLPVTSVSWRDCQEFINKLNASTKGGYRLPYEAEWEYACRAGTSTAYSFGGILTKSDANIDSDSIKAVGSYKPNAFGLYDMHGNAWEWCEDWFGSLQYGDIKDPMGPIMGERRVLRGGSFGYGVSQARSSYRQSNSPFDRYILHPGFRLARTP